MIYLYHCICLMPSCTYTFYCTASMRWMYINPTAKYDLRASTIS